MLGCAGRELTDESSSECRRMIFFFIVRICCEKDNIGYYIAL